MIQFKHIIYSLLFILILTSCASSPLSNVEQTSNVYENVSKYAVLDAAKRLFINGKNSNELLLDSYRNEVNATYIIPHPEFMNMDIVKKTISIKVEELNATNDLNSTNDLNTTMDINSSLEKFVLDNNITKNSSKLIVTLSLNYNDAVNDTDIKYFSKYSHQQIWEQLNYYLGVNDSKKICLILDPSYEMASKAHCLTFLFRSIDNNTTAIDMNKYIYVEDNNLSLDNNTTKIQNDVISDNNLSKDIKIVDIDLTKESKKSNNIQK